MKFSLYLLFSFVGLSAFCQTGTINFTDSLGRKQGHWIFYGKDRPDSGIPGEGKVEEGDYLNDRKEGLWIKYHDDGKTPKIKCEYKNNRPVGVYVRTGISGIPKEIGTFEKNRQLDSLKRFYDNGKLEYEAWYNENGKEHGRVNYFYESGQLEWTYIATDGVPSQSVRYDINGQMIPGRTVIHSGEIKEPITYIPDSVKNYPVSTQLSETRQKTPLPHLPETPNTRDMPFKPNGYNKVYNSDNEIWLDGTFVNGQLYDGKHYVYDRDGILLWIQIFKKGVYHSDGQI